MIPKANLHKVLAHPPEILRAKLAPIQVEAKLMHSWTITHYYLNDPIARHFWSLIQGRRSTSTRVWNMIGCIKVIPTTSEMEDMLGDFDRKTNVFVSDCGGVLVCDTDYQAYAIYKEAIEILR